MIDIINILDQILFQNSVLFVIGVGTLGIIVFGIYYLTLLFKPRKKDDALVEKGEDKDEI